MGITDKILTGVGLQRIPQGEGRAAPIAKSVVQISFFDTENRGGVDKGFIAQFLFKAPYGVPRYTDLVNVRRLAASPFVSIPVNAVVDQLCAVPWKIVPKKKDRYEPDPDRDPETDPALKKRIDHVTSFFLNPNSRKESFADIRQQYLTDMLEVNSGVVQKIFNLKEELTGIVARDGTSFTMNPDPHGSFDSRLDIIFLPQFTVPNEPSNAGLAAITVPGDVRRQTQLPTIYVAEKAAYFQYGFLAANQIVPFGKREIMWMTRFMRTDNLYGRGVVEFALEIVQLLLWSVMNELDYFQDNNIPKGFISFAGLDADDLKAVKDAWTEQMSKSDVAGQVIRRGFYAPFLNQDAKWNRIQFTAQELDFIAQQKWFAKILWAALGVNMSEMGISDDVSGMTNQIVQSRVFKKRALNPILRKEEFHINTEIIREFDYDDVMFVFDMFDVQDEKERYELYKLQVEGGFFTVNEIRIKEGQDTVEWGDDPPQNILGQQGTNVYAGDGGKERQPRSQVRSTPEDGAKKTTRKIDEKALQPGDVPSDVNEFKQVRPNDRMEGELSSFLAECEKSVLAIVDQELSPDNLQALKSAEEKSLKLDRIVKQLRTLLQARGVKDVSDAVIREAYQASIDKVEVTFDMNFKPSPEQIDFIQKYSFDNIQGMTSDTSEKLRQVISRGMMNGDNPSIVKEKIRAVFDITQSRAQTIARDVMGRAENHGHLYAGKQAKAAGIDVVKEWFSRAPQCPICVSLNGTTVGIDEKFEHKGKEYDAPPEPHPNCNCRVLIKQRLSA